MEKRKLISIISIAASCVLISLFIFLSIRENNKLPVEPNNKLEQYMLDNYAKNDSIINELDNQKQQTATLKDSLKKQTNVTNKYYNNYYQNEENEISNYTPSDIDSAFNVYITNLPSENIRGRFDIPSLVE